LKTLIDGTFNLAVKDYLYLKNKNYSEKPALKLVGDRYRLSGVQRQALLRGIMSGPDIQKRVTRRIRNVEGHVLHVDGYNVLLTLMNYLLGKFVFIATDGFLRDVGGSYGKIKNRPAFLRAQRLLTGFVAAQQPAALHIYLDEPVKSSSLHYEQLMAESQRLNIPVEITLVPSVDDVLIALPGTDGLIASSDTYVIDTAQCPIYDAAQEILHTHLGIEIFSFTRFL